MKYRNKGIVTAIQWQKDGDHPSVSRFFSHDPNRLGLGWLKVGPEAGKIVFPGDFVITHPNGLVEVMDAHTFRSNYEQAL